MSAVRHIDARDDARAGAVAAGAWDPDARVWYVAYGSNMRAERLRHYLQGAPANPAGSGGGRRYPGCRDPRMPSRSVPVELPGAVYFATESAVWTGGRAFYDPQAPGSTWARAHLVTAGQFCDIAAQEMYEEPGRDLDLREALRAGWLRLGSGRYETVVCPGALDGLPLLTFTAPWRLDEVEHARPAAAYLAHLAEGLLESGAWTSSEVAAYLAALPGAAGAWSAREILDLTPGG